MSKDKLHTADIAEKLAEGLSLNKRVAEDFMKALIAIIEESLLANDTVKVKGLGTFKLQWNDPRKSVDVNTGDEIIIEGYYKVAFAPEEEVKALVNEPYAHLEPVLLSEEGEETTTVDDYSIDRTAAPLKLLNEQANEIKDILSEINSLNIKVEHETLNNADEMELPVNTEETFNGEESELRASDVKLSVPKDESKKLHLPTPSEEFQKKISKLAPVRNSKKNNRKTLDYFFIGIMFGGLLIYILIDYDVFSDIARQIRSLRMGYEPMPEYYQPSEIAPVIPVDTIPLDTLSVEVADSSDIYETAIDENNAEVDDLQTLFDQPRIYKEFIATEEVIPGSRLTRISERHYGVKEFWVYIYEANKDKFTSPDQITPGTVLKIPKLNPVLADKNNPRCMEYALKLHDLYVGK